MLRDRERAFSPWFQLLWGRQIASRSTRVKVYAKRQSRLVLVVVVRKKLVRGFGVRIKNEWVANALTSKSPTRITYSSGFQNALDKARL